MLRILVFGLLVVLLLSACGSSASTQQATDAQSRPDVTVYKSPT